MKRTNTHCLICIFIFLLATTAAFGQTGSQPGPPPAPFGGQPPKLSDGRNVVVGEVKKLGETDLTIAKPDGAEQVVAVDANTKFVSDHGDAMKLADFRTGDKVAATGTLKDGVFVAAQLAKIPSGPGAPPPLPSLPNPGSN